MTVDKFEEALKEIKKGSREGTIISWRVSAEEEGKYMDLPSELDTSLVKALRNDGIERLYTHQKQAWDAVQGKENVVVVSPTASGKTLCYNLPVANAILEDDTCKALYLFPTKALSQDQVAELHALSTDLSRPIRSYTYDGDTPADQRRDIRERAHIVVTNPDMLHMGILPHHVKWIKFFQGLKWVVVDEVHSYRGVFGSHVTNVLRRLKRICEFYGSSPQFVCCSATIANPREHTERLVEERVTVIDENGAPTGNKEFILYNPPVLNRETGFRVDPLLEAKRFALEFLKRDIQTIVFTTSRLGVEILVSYLREDLKKGPGEEEIVRGYRGGYLPDLRREIERGLREGRVKGVVGTNALELGIDIGQLDACIMTGYPGTISSTYQQAGRAGRRAGRSIAVLIARSLSLDQFIMTNTDYFFGQSPEHGRVNPDNLVILLAHIQCAAFELPFREEETFGQEDLGELLRYLEDSGVLHRAGDKWHWSSETYPADEISIRHVSSENFVIVDTTDVEQVIAEVDYNSAFTTIYEGAIYINEGEQYHVDRLDHDRRKAYVHRVKVNYYTDAISSTRVRILDVLDRIGEDEKELCVEWGEVEVREKAEGFKKIRFYTQENLGYGEINLPEQEIHTTGFWIAIPYDYLSHLGQDRYSLVDGLLGVAYAMHTVACVMLMCEYRDLGRSIGDRFAEWYIRSSPVGRGVYNSARPDEMLRRSQTTSFRPTLFLYDGYPGGVGFSELLFAKYRELVERSNHLIKGCSCEHGCPSCVGPVVHGSDRSREVAVVILEKIMGDFI